MMALTETAPSFWGLRAAGGGGCGCMSTLVLAESAQLSAPAGLLSRAGVCVGVWQRCQQLWRCVGGQQWRGG